MEFIQSFGEYLVANPTAMVAVTLYQALWTMLGCWFAARNDHKIWFAGNRTQKPAGSGY